jgi:hypothetical protein
MKPTRILSIGLITILTVAASQKASAQDFYSSPGYPAPPERLPNPRPITPKLSENHRA